MNQNRQIIKSGQLQAKVLKKKGTLLRKKKKVIFGPEEWIVFCVHDDRVPLLEWYSSRATIFTHEPQKVVDLLDCQFCQININENRCFTIGFNDPDRLVMEFAARSSEECVFWVDHLVSTLKRLNCITASENVYDLAPSFSALNISKQSANSNDSLSANTTTPRSRSSPQLPRVLQLHDEIPFPAPPPSSPTHVLLKTNSSPSRNSTLDRRTTSCSVQTAQRTKKNSETVAVESEVNENPPPLPPRKSMSLESSLPMTTTPILENTHDKNRNMHHQYDFPVSPSSQYDKVRFTKISEEDQSYDRICFRNVLLAEPSNNTSESSGVESPRLSVTSDPIQDVHSLLPPPRPPKAASYDHISVLSDTQIVHNEQRSSYDGLDKVKTISILLTICVENIAFVEVGSKIWIAGWSEDRNSSLCGLIHIGDELVEVGSSTLEGIHQLPALFYSQSIPGTPIRLKIRSLPHGIVYSLTRPDADVKSLGIVLHKKKNKIENITPKSPASFSQIPHRMSPYLYGASSVMPVITEVDNLPLSLFASNEQFLRRVERLPPGTTFTIILHPLDFIRLIKEQMKHVKNARKFIQDFL